MAEQKLPDKAQENEMKREKVRVVPIKYIDDSPDHPFQVRDDEEMMSLVESIATFGVITPVIARKTADERYELISGHRRKDRSGAAEIRQLRKQQWLPYKLEGRKRRKDHLHDGKTDNYRHYGK